MRSMTLFLSLATTATRGAVRLPTAPAMLGAGRPSLPRIKYTGGVHTCVPALWRRRLRKAQ